VPCLKEKGLVTDPFVPLSSMSMCVKTQMVDIVVLALRDEILRGCGREVLWSFD